MTKNPGSASKHLSIFSPKNYFLRSRKYDPDLDFVPIPYPGYRSQKKAPDPGAWTLKNGRSQKSRVKVCASWPRCRPPSPRPPPRLPRPRTRPGPELCNTHTQRLSSVNRAGYSSAIVKYGNCCCNSVTCEGGREGRTARPHIFCTHSDERKVRFGVIWHSILYFSSWTFKRPTKN